MTYKPVQKEPPKCPYCRGTGRIYNLHDFVRYDCSECNGTGIQGSPGWLLLILLVYAIMFAIVVVIAL